VGWLAIVLLLSAFAVLIIDLIRQRKVIKKEEKEIEILEDKVEQIQKEEQAESKEIEKIEEEMKKIKKS
jgi:cytochrome c-type biogenesis protein CcmH/NrfG